MAVRIPKLDAWDQFVWPPSVAMPWAATEVEQYGYHHSNAIDLSPVMPAMEFRVTDKEGAYLCVVQALIFEGSVLVYNPTRDEVERLVVALVNFMPHVPQEADCIAELRAHYLLG